MKINGLLAGIAWALASLSVQAAVVEIVPVNQDKNIGDDVVVDVVGTGFATATIGGGFSLSFDPAILGIALADVKLADGVQLAGPWDSTFPRTETLSPGLLADVSFNQFAGVAGDFPIAQLKFKALAFGLSNLALGPSFTFAFSDSSGNPIEVGFNSGSVNVVPEPATWGMLAAGLALVGLFSMRRQHSA